MRAIRHAAVLAILLGVLFPSAIVRAAESSSATTQTQAGSGYSVTVSPVRLELSGKPGTSIEATVQIVNASASPVTLAAEAVDFTAQDEKGKPAFVPTGKSEWSMSNWVTAVPPTFTLKPGEKRVVAVNIAIPDNAEPGGHYAAILFASAPSAGGQTSVVAKVGSLILLSVAGRIRESAAASLVGPWLFESGPAVITTRFANSGNVHVKPTGKVTVSGLRGGTVTTLELEGSNVLPRSARVFDATWKDPPIGVYAAEADLTFGSSANKVSTGKRYIVVFPWKLGLAGVGLFGLGLLTSLLLRRKKE